MREILFRIWDEYNQTMRYGFPYFESGVKGFREILTGSCFGTEKSNGGFYKEIMQFTGLLDNTGKRIFEGDIVNVSAEGQEPHYILVEMLEGYLSIIMFIKSIALKIAGNKFQNPELLKKGVKNGK